jgi:hypothetical protein
MKENGLRVVRNTTLRIIIAPSRNKVTGHCGKLYSEELLNISFAKGN